MSRRRFPSFNEIFPKVKDRQGRYICRYCKGPVPKRRKFWCSKECNRKATLETSWGYVRHLVLKRDKSICKICKSKANCEVDHIVPLAEGGAAYDLSNLRALCSSCHKAETSKLLKRLAEKRKQEKKHDISSL